MLKHWSEIGSMLILALTVCFLVVGCSALFTGSSGDTDENSTVESLSDVLSQVSEYAITYGIPVAQATLLPYLVDQGTITQDQANLISQAITTVSAQYTDKSVRQQNWTAKSLKNALEVAIKMRE